VEEEMREGRRQGIRVLTSSMENLIEQVWSSEQVMAQEKMKKTREAAKNPSHVGRAGRQRA